MKTHLFLIAASTVLTAVSVAAAQNPNLSGRWELVGVERNGHRYNIASDWKESHIIVDRQQTVKIKMIVDGKPGYRTVDLTLSPGEKEQQIGTQRWADGTENPVLGSSHWDGNKLVYEQAIFDSKNKTTLHIIRSMELSDNGSKVLGHHHLWTTPNGMKDDATEYWEKRPDVP